MADNKLYKVAITLDGKYVHGKEYDKLVQVFYDEADGGDGCSYVSRKKNVNVRPGTDDTVWQKASDRGTQGEQGQSGPTGASAGFGTPTASVSGGTGTPSVQITASGPDTAKVFNFDFSNLKGETGATGATGATGPQGPAGVTSAVVSVDGTSGTPSASATVSEGVLSISFSGLKGDQGNSGYSGAAGELEVVNNDNDGGEDDAWSAERGKIIRQDLTQLEAEVHNLSGKYYGVFADETDLPEGDAPGYAFVGEENPYAIWNFDGTDWSDSGSVANGITGEPGVGFSSIFTPVPYDGTMIIVLSNNDTITVNLNHNHNAAATTLPSGGFLPDVVYSLGTLTGTVTFALADAVTGNINHYFWMFDTSSTAPTVTWPAGLTWADGSAPTIQASKHYEISVLGGVAYYSEV